MDYFEFYSLYFFTIFAICSFIFRLLNKSKKMNSGVKGKHLAVPAKRPLSGALRQRSMCVDSMDGPEGSTIAMYSCHGQGRNQVGM